MGDGVACTVLLQVPIKPFYMQQRQREVGSSQSLATGAAAAAGDCSAGCFDAVPGWSQDQQQQPYQHPQQHLEQDSQAVPVRHHHRQQQQQQQQQHGARRCMASPFGNVQQQLAVHAQLAAADAACGMDVMSTQAQQPWQQQQQQLLAVEQQPDWRTCPRWVFPIANQQQ
jgi:hypothetical protein